MTYSDAFLNQLKLYFCRMKSLMENIKKIAPYFVDVWQYLLIIVIFIIAAIFFL